MTSKEPDDEPKRGANAKAYATRRKTLVTPRELDQEMYRIRELEMGARVPCIGGTMRAPVRIDDGGWNDE